MHPQTTGLVFTGRIWTIDSWDGETFTVEMKDQNGNVMDSFSTQGNNFAQLGDQTLNCGNSVGGWSDGVFEVSLRSDYDKSMGDVTIEVTNALDQGAGDESIGYGDMRLNYEFDDGRPKPATANIDEGVTDPSELWENNCGASVKTCQGHRYYGGHNECAQGHSFWRVFRKADMHAGVNRLNFNGKIWTIDSWDGEHFTVEMTT
jgi:hypothetical protein